MATSSTAWCNTPSGWPCWATVAYRTVLMLNTLLNVVRRRLGFGYWSFSAFLKVKVKNALQFIENYEIAVADEARRRGVDGVICGHIHKAEMRQIGDITYINDGDWVESCTALVEHFDGRLEILEWAKLRSWSMIRRARQPHRGRAYGAPDRLMRILLATDAWEPQVNGVVRTLTRVVAELREMGDTVEVISPDQFPDLPAARPTRRSSSRSAPTRRCRSSFKSFEPEAIHIATEGPIGLAARRICIEWKLPFTTSYHTRFPEYVSARLPVPLAAGYAYMKWFHRPSGRLMVATPTLRDELSRHGFRNLSQWSRGVDTELFHPRWRQGGEDPYAGLARPIFLNVGRVAVEKNIEAFVSLDLPGTKVVVGDGPQREELAAQYPAVVFAGARFGEELAALLRRRGRLRLPFAHRHLRPGAAGSDGVGHAGGGVLGPRPGRHHPGLRGRRRRARPDHRSEGSRARLPEARPCGGARLRRAVLLVGLRRGVPPQPAAVSGAGEEPLLAPPAPSGAPAPRPQAGRSIRLAATAASVTAGAARRPVVAMDFTSPPAFPMSHGSGGPRVHLRC